MTSYQNYCPLHEWDWNQCERTCRDLKAQLRLIDYELRKYWRGLAQQRVAKMLKRHVTEVA